LPPVCPSIGEKNISGFTILCSPGTPPALLAFGRLIHPLRHVVDLAKGGRKRIAKRELDVRVSAVRFRLVLDEQRLLARNADFDPHMEKLRQRRAPLRSGDGDTGMGDTVEVAFDAFEFFPDTGLNRFASLEAVERDLEWSKHSIRLSLLVLPNGSHQSTWAEHVSGSRQNKS
jgi:hypothetical protein